MKINYNKESKELIFETTSEQEETEIGEAYRQINVDGFYGNFLLRLRHVNSTAQGYNQLEFDVLSRLKEDTPKNLR